MLVVQKVHAISLMQKGAVRAAHMDMSIALQFIMHKILHLCFSK